jgi:hypothetical protein
MGWHPAILRQPLLPLLLLLPWLAVSPAAAAAVAALQNLVPHHLWCQPLLVLLLLCHLLQAA